jgi:hypothetical protein
MLPQKIAVGSIHVMARPLAEQRAEGAHFKPHGLPAPIRTGDPSPEAGKIT